MAETKISHTAKVVGAEVVGNNEGFNVTIFIPDCITGPTPVLHPVRVTVGDRWKVEVPVEDV